MDENEEEIENLLINLIFKKQWVIVLNNFLKDEIEV